MKWTLFLIGIILIVIRGFWSNYFVIDSLTILLFFIISLPYLSSYLKRAKIPGAEFEFKDSIKKIEKTVQRSIDKSKEATKENRSLYFKTFNVSSAKRLLELESDSSLALAALRIEIERKLRSAADFLNIQQMPLLKLVKAIGKKKILYPDQVASLLEIIEICNKSIHGYVLFTEDAQKVIDLVEKLNSSFSVGYSIDFSPNPDYKEHGLVCGWEHCIEWMPLTEKLTKKSCRLFGHNCPGGIEKVTICGKTIKDFPKKRFIK